MTEALDDRRIVAQVVPDTLQHDLAVERPLVAQVDDAHAATTDLAEDLVASDLARQPLHVRLGASRQAARWSRRTRRASASGVDDDLVGDRTARRPPRSPAGRQVVAEREAIAVQQRHLGHVAAVDADAVGAAEIAHAEGAVVELEDRVLARDRRDRTPARRPADHARSSACAGRSGSPARRRCPSMITSFARCSARKASNGSPALDAR